jgi:hypothetical protein
MMIVAKFLDIARVLIHALYVTVSFPEWIVSLSGIG